MVGGRVRRDVRLGGLGCDGVGWDVGWGWLGCEGWGEG